MSSSVNVKFILNMPLKCGKFSNLARRQHKSDAIKPINNMK